MVIDHEVYLSCKKGNSSKAKGIAPIQPNSSISPGLDFGPSVPNWVANSYSNILKGMNGWITKIHDSKVGVVAFYKISACLLFTF